MREFGDFEIEILQWGKILEKNEENIIQISNVSKIYEPEPDRIPIEYIDLKLTEIPEWLFSKKVTSTVMSKFGSNNSIVSIPEGLFKDNVNVVSFDHVFSGCSGITSIPEGLFKNNVNVTNFSDAFSYCSGITSIPEGLFKNNVNVTNFSGTFSDCSGITSIPEGLFKNNVKAIDFSNTFNTCKGLTSIPGKLFNHNINAKNFFLAFKNCENLMRIPEEIIEDLKRAREKGADIDDIFEGCISASNYSSIPSYMT